MNIRSFVTDTKIDLLLSDPDGDNETLYGAGVDMAGYEGVIFVATCRRGEAGTLTLKVQQDTDVAFGTAADLLGTAKTLVIATGTDAKAIVEVVHPGKRYLRPALVIPNLGTARAVSIIAIRYGAKYLPETNADAELHVNPAEGTA
jgi:hypothetical protein